MLNTLTLGYIDRDLCTKASEFHHDCHTFLFHEKHHPQGFLGSELGWDLQVGGRLHRRAVIFVIVIVIVTNRRKFQSR